MGLDKGVGEDMYVSLSLWSQNAASPFLSWVSVLEKSPFVTRPKPPLFCQWEYLPQMTFGQLVYTDDITKCLDIVGNWYKLLVPGSGSHVGSEWKISLPLPLSVTLSFK